MSRASSWTLWNWGTVWVGAFGNSQKEGWVICFRTISEDGLDQNSVNSIFWAKSRAQWGKGELSLRISILRQSGREDPTLAPQNRSSLRSFLEPSLSQHKLRKSVLTIQQMCLMVHVWHPWNHLCDVLKRQSPYFVPSESQCQRS